MACLTLLILIATTGTIPMPRRVSTAAFPTKTPSWELTDAVEELRDPTSTPLWRQVARARLEQLGAGCSALPPTIPASPK